MQWYAQNFILLKVFSGFLLLKAYLQHLTGRVEVERHVGDHEVLAEVVELVLHEYSLARTGVTHEHHRAPLLYQHVQEILDSDCLSSVHQGGLRDYNQITGFMDSVCLLS